MIGTFSHISRNNFKTFYYSAKYNLVPLLNYEGGMYIFQKNNLISKENEKENEKNIHMMADLGLGTIIISSPC